MVFSDDGGDTTAYSLGSGVWLGRFANPARLPLLNALATVP